MSASSRVVIIVDPFSNHLAVCFVSVIDKANKLKEIKGHPKKINGLFEREAIL